MASNSYTTISESLAMLKELYNDRGEHLDNPTDLEKVFYPYKGKNNRWYEKPDIFEDLVKNNPLIAMIKR